MPPNKNSLPARVKSRTKTNKFPTNSKPDLIKPTFNTPIAKINCAPNPIATVFQLIPLRFALNKKATNNKESIPKTPRPIPIGVMPSLGFNSPEFALFLTLLEAKNE